MGSNQSSAVLIRFLLVLNFRVAKIDTTKVTTDGFDTSPILRGAWISKNIVGTPLSPPPESVPALEPEHGHAETLKEQIEQHKTNKTCYACHKSIDPYGFALESFDATGGWRERYRIKQPHRGTFQYRLQGYYQLGSEVDASGEIEEEEFDDGNDEDDCTAGTKCWR